MSKVKAISFTFQYASIKPAVAGVALYMYKTFTFQYASIKPVRNKIGGMGKFHLHFNMLLLNQSYF